MKSSWCASLKQSAVRVTSALITPATVPRSTSVVPAQDAHDNLAAGVRSVGRHSPLARRVVGAQSNFGVCYHAGTGVAKDAEEAVRL
jgi:TPR repeat protein